MIVTEEEAKTKRCQEGYPAAYGLSEGGKQAAPIATHSAASPISINAGFGAAYAVYSQPHGGAPLHCLGGACMAWRWKRGSLYVPDPIDPSHFTEFEDKGDQARTIDGIPLGFCGKAR